LRKAGTSQPPYGDASQPVEEVSRFLDHSSLAVTMTYLRRLECQENKNWEKVATAIGLQS
jgi:hypothetical protein